MSLAYSVQELASPADLDAVDSELDRYNVAVPALHDVRRLCVFARDAAAAVHGGAVGRTWGACCECLPSWVREAEQQHGAGTHLMQRFEAEAGRRDCGLASLETLSFQVPAVCQRLG